MDESLRGASAIGVDDLKVAEPQRPPSPETTLALESRRGLAGLGRRSASLRLEVDRLVVTYPSLLCAPLMVDRDDVVVAAVDTRRREGGDTARFPYSHEFEWTQPFPRPPRGARAPPPPPRRGRTPGGASAAAPPPPRPVSGPGGGPAGVFFSCPAPRGARGPPAAAGGAGGRRRARRWRGGRCPAS